MPYPGTRQDDEVFGEGADFITFQEEDVITQVEQGPVIMVLLKTTAMANHLVFSADGNKLHTVLPLVMEVGEGFELMLDRAGRSVNKLQ